jgi:hypothetical protein
MISEKHKSQHKALHQRREEYGAAGHIFADLILSVAQSMNTKDVLDYGAGKQSLAKSVPFLDIKSYDPCVEEISQDPEPADVVVCTHVLPYVENDHLNGVLEHLKSLTKKAVIFAINTEESGKLLDDGESVTKVKMGIIEWLGLLEEYFDILTLNRINDKEFTCVYIPKD